MTNLTIAQIEHANDIGPGETERGAEIRRTLYPFQPQAGEETMDERTRAAWILLAIGAVAFLLFCGGLYIIVKTSPGGSWLP